MFQSLLDLMPRCVWQVVDAALDDDGGAPYATYKPYIKPSERVDQPLEPLRLALGSLAHLTRLLLRGSTPSAYALSELPPLRVGSTVPLGLLTVVSIHAVLPVCAGCDLSFSSVKHPLALFVRCHAGIGTSGLLRSGQTAGAVPAPLQHSDQVGPRTRPWPTSDHDTNTS